MLSLWFCFFLEENTVAVMTIHKKVAYSSLKTVNVLSNSNASTYSNSSRGQLEKVQNPNPNFEVFYQYFIGIWCNILQNKKLALRSLSPKHEFCFTK